LYTFIQSDLDEQGTKLHVLIVTLSVESKEMSCGSELTSVALATLSAHRRMHQWGTGDF